MLVPLQCEFYALEGLSHLVRTIERVKRRFNPELEIEGVVLTMFDKRNKLSDLVAADVRDHFGDKVYRTVIPRNVRVSEAPSHGKPVLLYDFRCTGAQACMVHLAGQCCDASGGWHDKRAAARLGTGLSALLGEEERAPQPGGGVKTVAIEKLHPGRFQPRRHFDEAALDALAQSIAAQGVLQPLLVRQHPSLAGEFEIRRASGAGARRSARSSTSCRSSCAR